MAKSLKTTKFEGLTIFIYGIKEVNKNITGNTSCQKQNFPAVDSTGRRSYLCNYEVDSECIRESLRSGH